MFNFKNTWARIVLNLLRGLNIISLLGVIVADVLLLMKTFQINGFFFFDSLTHVITILFAIFLIISEVPFLDMIRTFYQRNFPLLSYESGLAPLGLLLIVEGCFVLSNLNNDAANSKDFGQSFYSAIVFGGILPLIAGVLNGAASFIFCDRKLGLTSRMIRHYGRSKAQNVAQDVHNGNRDAPENYQHEDIERKPSRASSFYSQPSRYPHSISEPMPAHTRI